MLIIELTLMLTKYNFFLHNYENNGDYSKHRYSRQQFNSKNKMFQVVLFINLSSKQTKTLVMTFSFMIKKECHNIFFLFSFSRPSSLPS